MNRTGPQLSSFSLLQDKPKWPSCPWCLLESLLQTQCFGLTLNRTQGLKEAVLGHSESQEKAGPSRSVDFELFPLCNRSSPWPRKPLALNLTMSGILFPIWMEAELPHQCGKGLNIIPLRCWPRAPGAIPHPAVCSLYLPISHLYTSIVLPNLITVRLLVNLESL